MAMRTFSLSRRPSPDATAWEAVSDFQSQTAEILSARPPLTARLTLHTLAALVASIIVLAGVLSVDRIVTGRGRVASEKPRIVVQPLETSIVRQILVKEGQVVRAGDLLARLDPTFQTADATLLTRRVSGLEAEVARIRAELAGKPYHAESPDNLDAVLQERLYDSRQAEYRAAIESFRGKIAANETTIERAKKEYASYSQRLALMTEVEAMRKTLEAKATGSRLNTIAASDLKVEMERNAAAQDGILRASQSQLEVARAELAAYQQKWISDLAQGVVDKQRALDEAREQYSKAARRRDLVEMRAVEDAVVLMVGDISVGSVIESAKKMFTLVPLTGGLKVEVEITGRDQGFVHVGQEVAVKFDAWPFNQHGTATGTVRSISGDSFSLKSDQGASAPSVYVATIDITKNDLRGVPEDFRLVPGMPLSADIVVGEQTLMRYLLSRAMPVLSEGMQEP
jgi:HlyD family type I secretion membrane fusion protein